MTEGNTGFEHQLFFHTTYVNSLTSEYKHLAILFSKRKWYQWMNDIIPAKNYSLHKHRFYAIQKN